MTSSHVIPTEIEMKALGASIASEWSPGTIVLLWGDLGAGKTTFVRGVLAGLGYMDAVRSPTFNLVQLFDTKPPVLHSDLYRLTSAEGVGLEDYLETHICLIEWPDRASEIFEGEAVWNIRISFSDLGREVTIQRPD